MIRTHSDDPDVAEAANEAYVIISGLLAALPEATSYDYGGQQLVIGEYDVCIVCTKAIAEAQAAQQAIEARAASCDDATVKEHLDEAAALFASEAHVATLRAEFHNGVGTEKILNNINGFVFDRAIHDQYDHSHEQGDA